MLDRLRAETWLPAEVFSYAKGSRTRDPEYRNAFVLGEVQVPDAIGRLEAEASEVAAQLLSTFGNVFDELRLSGSQFVSYPEGGFFRPHRDAANEYWNRCFTLIKYLTPCDGGQTCFPEQNVGVAVQLGTWLIFYSELLHYAAPVVAGEKIIFVTWLVP